MIKMIIASDENGGIGLDNKLPWDCPEDLQYFKNQTHLDVVVMGSKTFESLGFKKLPNRKNIVVTSHGQNSVGLNRGIVNRVKDLHWLTSKGFEFYTRFDKDVWIIGGKSIYEQTLDLVEEIHHTVISGDYLCDTFVDTSLWVGNKHWRLSEKNVLSDKATVFIYRRLDGYT